MLGTKLKNSRKLTVIMVIMSIVIPALCMINQYWNWYASSGTVVENAAHAEVRK